MNIFDKGYYNSNELTKFGFKQIGSNVSIAKNTTILGLKNIEIGNNVRIDSYTTIACNKGELKIGSNVHVSSSCYINCNGGVHLRDFSGLSQGVKIYSCSDDYSGDYMTNPTINSKYTNNIIGKVVIGKHVINGSGSVILPKVKIGEGSSIGALSLVNNSLESWNIYFGLPVKKIKKRNKKILELEKNMKDD